MKIKKYILILVAISIIVACKHDNEIMSNEDVSKLSDGSYKIPSHYGMVELFVLSDNQDIIMTNTDYLRYVYDHHFLTKFKTYYEFLSKTLNHKIKLDHKNFDGIPYESFKISERIEKQYRNLKLKGFLKKYITRKHDTSILSISTQMPYNEILTISYYLYLNGYQTKFSDHSPQYVVMERDRIMNN